MFDESIGLFTAGLSPQVELASRSVYARFLKKANLKGKKWALKITKQQKPGLISIESTAPTRIGHCMKTIVAMESQIPGTLRHVLEGHYERYCADKPRFKNEPILKVIPAPVLVSR